MKRVLIRGEFDMYAAPQFSADLLPRIKKGCCGICFDLSEVSYLDSSGVGALIKILQAARQHSVEVRFRGIQGTPRKVLRMSNILPLLQEEMQEDIS